MAAGPGWNALKGLVVKHELSETTLAADQVHDPSIGWGFLPLSKAVKLGWGGARKVMRGAVELEPLKEWLPSPASWVMPARGLYLPPTLKLTPGEALTVHYEKGPAVVAKITQAYGSTAKRAADRMMKEHPPTPRNRWEIIKDL
jgi:hypothetical protein